MAELESPYILIYEKKLSGLAVVSTPARIGGAIRQKPTTR